MKPPTSEYYIIILVKLQDYNWLQKYYSFNKALTFPVKFDKIIKRKEVCE
nr:MAG TPA: hypothetical protein [Caudoviricetes sp.]